MKGKRRRKGTQPPDKQPNRKVSKILECEQIGDVSGIPLSRLVVDYLPPDFLPTDVIVGTGTGDAEIQSWDGNQIKGVIEDLEWYDAALKRKEDERKAA